MRLVAPMRAFGRADVGLVGGKGANLGELVKTGFRVPDGFVVTTQAYAATIESADLRIALRENGGAALRAVFAEVAIPQALGKAIADAYVELGGGPVAVRSSATAEDLPGAAAVVVDSGGPASHAAIVAREYGIPAVMGTVNGTTVLTDGQVVTVDGYTGRVTSGS